MSRRGQTSCGTGALRGFSWTELAPFASLFAFDLAFLGFALAVGSSAGMAVAGEFAMRVGGLHEVRYPAFYASLPSVLSKFDAIVYAVIGSVVIPFGVARIVTRLRSESVREAGRRARRAVPATAIAFFLALGILFGWDALVAQSSATMLAPLLRKSDLAVFGLVVASNLVLYAIFAITLHVPIAAVFGDGSGGFQADLREGLGFGFRRLPVTLAYVLAFSSPVIAIQLFLGALGGSISSRLQPEAMVAITGAVAGLSALATYLIYGAASRLQHQAASEGA